MVIQHNIFAMQAHDVVTGTNTVFNHNQEKLSSGYRINRASDDAAGLAMSEKMRSQIRSIHQAQRNCEDGMALVQTAEGALDTVHELLKRMNELAVESANGTYDNKTDRAAIQLEVSQLKDEINRIAESTMFSSIKLLDGSLSKTGEVCLGPQHTFSGPLVYVYEEIIHDVDAVQSPASGATNTLSGYDSLKTALKNQLVPQAVKAITTSFADTFSYLNGSKIGIGLDLYSDAGSSVLASVGLGAGGTIGDINLNYTLRVNLAHLNFDASGNLTSDSRQELEATITHEMMHALMDEAHTAGMLGRDNNWNTISEFPSWFTEGAAQVVGGGKGWVNSIGINSSSTTDEIKNVLSNGTNKIGSGTNASEYASGYLAVMYLGYLASGDMTGAGLADGVDTILRELKAGASLDSVINDLTGCTDTTDFENKFADLGKDFVADLMDAIGNGRGSVANKNLSQTDLLPDTNATNTLFSLDTTKTSIHNDYPDNYDVMSGGGRSDNGTSADGSVPTSGGLTPGGTTPTPTPPDPTPPDPTPTTPTPPGATSPATPTPVPDKDEHNGLIMQAGARTKDTSTIYIESVSTTSLGIDDVNVSTQESANKAIDIVRSAIDKVSMQRADIGAYHNRIQHKLDSLTVTHENLTSSESFIRDADIATEMSFYVRNKLLLDVGNAMFAQANIINQNVLALLA